MGTQPVVRICGGGLKRCLQAGKPETKWLLRTLAQKNKSLTPKCGGHLHHSSAALMDTSAALMERRHRCSTMKHRYTT